ncbi:hypothetical protein O3G_MSEX014522 [Manduca sexta]|uniref:Secreted protein n=1 Tax=Manduca sexta TaxID=7130 RepID=A0A922CZR3_MANSE|nr:hypothetical protein O3G_MSEX014522 [Manduca sexta]
MYILVKILCVILYVRGKVTPLHLMVSGVGPIECRLTRDDYPSAVNTIMPLYWNRILCTVVTIQADIKHIPPPASTKQFIILQTIILKFFSKTMFVISINKPSYSSVQRPINS